MYPLSRLLIALATFAFKDCALQFLGNLFEFFLVRRNHVSYNGERLFEDLWLSTCCNSQGKIGTDRHRLCVIGATSGDTGSAVI